MYIIGIVITHSTHTHHFHRAHSLHASANAIMEIGLGGAGGQMQSGPSLDNSSIIRRRVSLLLLCVCVWHGQIMILHKHTHLGKHTFTGRGECSVRDAPDARTPMLIAPRDCTRVCHSRSASNTILMDGLSYPHGVLLYFSSQLRARIVCVCAHVMRVRAGTVASGLL